MNFKRSGRKNKRKASYGLEAVNEPLEEATSQLQIPCEIIKTHLTLRIFQG